MIKCTGICSSCGKCAGSAMMKGANDRKTRMLIYPEDFTPDKGNNGLGAAFDIGTTTVVGMLWDLEKGEQLSTYAMTNPQNEFGMDVISRITYCGENSENLPVLREKIISGINDITAELLKKAEKQDEKIVKAVVGGNSTMSHIFAGYSPRSLALAPFLPAYTGTVRMTGKESGLNIDEKGEVVVTANIAGHVGGDITAGIVSSRILDSTDLCLFIDIGTNGEIVLTDGSETYTCSTAAGPAFEGASIHHGMRAAEGAIEKVTIENGTVEIRTIGDREPQGICGSGLIDAVAQMIDAGLVKKSGRILSAEEGEKKGIHKNLCSRLVAEGKERRFILAERDEEDDIVITQNDIREVQLAKGAISAGITLMLKVMGKAVGDISRVVVAGAFGNYIDKKSAVTIGVLPKVEQEKIISAGNTAGAGVSMMLVSRKEMELAEKIPEIVKHIELADMKEFQDTYVGAMAF